MDVIAEPTWTIFVKSRARRLAEVSVHSPREAINTYKGRAFNSLVKTECQLVLKST